MSIIPAALADPKPSLLAALACAGVLVGSAAFAKDQAIQFQHTEVGATADPTGLFLDEEVAEGGSDSMPSIWYSTFPVDGGEVTVAVLANAWCGMAECPMRYRIRSLDGAFSLLGYEPPNYGTICQAFMEGSSDAITYDPIELTIDACGNILDLKGAR